MRKITSEYVSDGHPDKMADQISDLVLDMVLREEPESKVAIETLIKNSTVIVAGELTTPQKNFFNNRFKRILNKEIRHLINELGFPANHELKPADVEILYLIGEQSMEINKAVVDNDGAGDQGFMIGYASNDSPDYLPLGLYVSKKILQYIRENLNDDYGPDMKSQVTVDEFKNIETIVLSTMMKNDNEFSKNQKILEDIIRNNHMGLPHNIAKKITSDTSIIINPAGDWKIGGPVSDCGVTGRKIVVDQYGCYSHVGGGAFSGKDPSKVDRSAAYMCRHIAKSLVHSKVYDECFVELGYAIGMSEPVSFSVYGKQSHHEFVLNKEELEALERIFPLQPKDIIEYFDLKRPIYLNAAKNGHFGNDDMPWESVVKVSEEQVSRARPMW